jgi:hypothetical protein
VEAARVHSLTSAFQHIVCSRRNFVELYSPRIGLALPAALGTGRVCVGPVIDELMGHQASGRAGRHPGSAIGAHYRHTTPEMAARVVAAVEERLVVVLATAEAALDRQPW